MLIGQLEIYFDVGFVQVFCLFSYWVTFLLLICRSSLYIEDMSALSDIYITDISSYSESQRFMSSYESGGHSFLGDQGCWGMAAGGPNASDFKFLSPTECTSLGQDTTPYSCIFPSTTTALSPGNSSPPLYRKVV